jgi:ankyrin repeat protein
VDIFRQCLEVVQDTVQPHHAEWYLLLARYHAEGFGTAINYSEMIECLKKSASHGSVEASFMLLFIEPHFPNSTLKPAPLRKPIMVKGIPIFESPMNIAMQKIREQGTLLPPRVQYIGMIQLWNKENCSYVRDQPFSFQGTAFLWKKKVDMARFIDEVRAGPLSIWDITIEFESLDSSLQSAGFFEACVAFGTNAWWTMAMDYAQYEQNISTEQKQVVFYNCLIAALQNGQSFFIDAMEALEDEGFLRDIANKIIEERSSSPFHFLPLYSTNEAKLQSVASKLLSMGFGQTVNQNLTKRQWLRPLGVGVYGSPLHTAIRVRSLPAVRALMEAGASPFETTGSVEDSPLELAICLNLHEIVQFILDRKMISNDLVQSCTQALGKISSKGIFNNWILHPRGSPSTNRLSTSIQNTIRELSCQLGGLKLSKETILLQYLEAGCKSVGRLELLWQTLEKKDGCDDLSSQTIEKGLALAEKSVSDDPLNHDLLHFFFTTIMPLNNSKITQTQSEVSLLRWTKSGAIHIINSFSLHFKSEDWGRFVWSVNGSTSAVVDAAISSGCLKTFDFVMKHMSAEECLRRAIDCCAKECVTRVVTSTWGTIYCRKPTTTALHHAVAASNRSMVQHLLRMRIFRTTQHIQHLRPTSKTEPDLRVFAWDRVYNMKDRAYSNRTALDIAADADDTMTIEALLGSEPVNETTGSGAQTMLALAVRNGQVGLVKRLLMRQYSPYCAVQVTALRNSSREEDVPAWNFIFQALYYTFQGEIELSIFEKILALCKDEDIKSIKNRNPLLFWKTDRLWNGWLPIHYAIFCGRIGIFRAVLATEIWSPNEKITTRDQSMKHAVTDEISSWSNVFDYGQLLERETIEDNNAPDPKADLHLKPKNLLSRITTIKNNATTIFSTPDTHEVKVIRLDTDCLSNNQYRHCHLWAPGQEFTMDLNQVHRLIWVNKTCRQLALDLIAWHDFVRLPYKRGQQRIINKLSRTEVVYDLDKWDKEQKKMARKEAEHSLDVHLDISIRRMIRDVSEASAAVSEPVKLPSTTMTTIVPERTLEPEVLVLVPNL